MQRDSLLDRIYHDSPCSVSWESMPGDDRVRFCGHCRQHVYNLSELTQREAETLVREKGGKLCAQILRRPDGSVVTRNRRTPAGDWARGIRRAAAATLSTILGLGGTAALAQQPCKGPDYGRSAARLSYEEIAAARLAAVTGTVRDTTGFPIEGTSIELVRLGTNEKYESISSKQGVFAIDPVEPGVYAVRVGADGFQHYRAEEIRLRAGNKLQLEVDLAIGSVGGCALLPASETKTHWAATKKADTLQRESS